MRLDDSSLNQRYWDIEHEIEQIKDQTHSLPAPTAVTPNSYVHIHDLLTTYALFIWTVEVLQTILFSPQVE